MEQLTQQELTACTADSPRVTAAEIVKLSPQIPGWSIVEEEGESRLKRIYTFSDFLTALDFTNKVGDIAEKAGHHPALLTEWGKVTISWWTHSIGGLHKNDFIMAAKTDAIASD